MVRDWKENRKSLLFWLSFGAEGVTFHPSISQQTLHELCILQWHCAKNRTPRSFCLPMSSHRSHWPYTAWPQRLGHLHGPCLWGATMLQASTITNISFFFSLSLFMLCGVKGTKAPSSECFDFLADSIFQESSDGYPVLKLTLEQIKNSSSQIFLRVSVTSFPCCEIIYECGDHPTIYMLLLLPPSLSRSWV